MLLLDTTLTEYSDSPVVLDRRIDKLQELLDRYHGDPFTIQQLKSHIETLEFFKASLK